MTSPVDVLYDRLVDAGARLDPELARHLFNSALHEKDLARAGRVAALPGLPDDVSQAARKHRNAAVRAGWLANPDRSPQELAAAMDDKAASALVKLATDSRDPQLLAVFATRNAKAVDTKLLRNPATPAATVMELLERRADDARALSSKWLAMRLMGTPSLHDRFVRWAMGRGRLHLDGSATILSSPLLSQETILMCADAIEAMRSKASGLASHNQQWLLHQSNLLLRYLSMNPSHDASTVERLRKMKFDDVRHGSSVVSIGPVTSDPSFHRRLADPHTPSEELTVALRALPARQDASTSWTAGVVASHPNAPVDVAVEASGRAPYEVVGALLLQSWFSDRSFAARLWAVHGQWYMFKRMNMPEGAIDESELRREALLAALDEPSLPSMRSWSYLASGVRSVDELARLPLNVLPVAARFVPHDVLQEATVWLADRLGTIDAYRALSTIGTESEVSLRELVDTVELLIVQDPGVGVDVDGSQG